MIQMPEAEARFRKCKLVSLPFSSRPHLSWNPFTKRNYGARYGPVFPWVPEPIFPSISRVGFCVLVIELDELAHAPSKHATMRLKPVQKTAVFMEVFIFFDSDAYVSPAGLTLTS